MSSATILLVDDVLANRQVLVELLGPEGYRLTEAANGPEALARAESEPPDLVLLDVMMPGMDGFEVCRRIRAHATLADVPVIMVTALDDQASRLAGIDAGADDFVSKPFNRAELRARVRTVTRLNRYRRLADQRARFEWMVEHAADGYLLTDADDSIRFANSRARQWLSLPVDGDRLGTFRSAAGAMYTMQPPEMWQAWPAVPAETIGRSRTLVRAETPNARAHLLDVSVHETAGGRLIRLRDVTDGVAAARNQRAFQTLISHKLRTPLNAVHGMLSLLTTPGAVSGDDATRFLTMARDGADRLVNAVEDVLRFADVANLRHGARFVLGGFGDLARELAALVGIGTCRVSVPAELDGLHLPWPAQAVEWALVELFENAKKFHPQHSPEVDVTVTRPDASFVSISVADDGMTLGPDQLAMAGQPYVQGEKALTGEIPGMGLGLALVASLAWQVGGSCHVRNRPQRPGVEVRILLPAGEVAG